MRVGRLTYSKVLLPKDLAFTHEVPCVPRIDGSPIFMHYNSLYDLCDLEIYAYIVDKSQVHNLILVCLLLSLALCLLVTLICSPPPKLHVDACVPLPSAGHVTSGFQCLDS